MRLRIGVLVAALAASCAGKKAADAPGGQDPELPPDLVWVQRPDGTRSCRTRPAEKLESVARALRESGVTVYGSRHAHDGKMRAQLCGIPTGWYNAFRIRRGDLVKAAALELQLPEAGEAEGSPLAADEVVSDARPSPEPAASAQPEPLPSPVPAAQPSG